MATKLYYIPSGPKNLSILFPDINWNEISDYRVNIYDTNGDQIAQTPNFKIGCCCDENRVRILFYNYDGSFDGINFNKPIISHDTVSSSYQIGLNSPLEKTDTGLERLNINANDTYSAFTTCYKERDKEWLQQVVDSPKAFIQWIGIEGQQDSYIPIVILDGKYDKVSAREFDYIFTIQFKLSNDIIVQRN